MDQYITTYRKDYIWPYVQTLPITSGPRDTKNLPDVMGPLGSSHHECWCRSGPTGPLRDPKFYPARVGVPPEKDTSRYDQPSAYMAKLYQKYPFLYKVLMTHPPDDLMNRVFKDRLITTYQTDYCKMGEVPSDQYDALLTACGVGPKPPEMQTDSLPDSKLRPTMAGPNLAYRPATISSKCGKKGKEAKGSSSKNKGGDSEDVDKSVYSPGMSEYKDTISRRGELIMKDKIHYSLDQRLRRS